MKNGTKLLALAVCAALLLPLYGCGKKAEVKNAEGLIDAIGQVTLESEEAVAAAESAYNALSEQDRAAVENYGVLSQALEDLRIAREAEIQRQLEALKHDLSGSWKQEQDITGQVVEGINAGIKEGVPPFRMEPGSMPVAITYRFRLDGTYERQLDGDLYYASMQKLMKALGAWLDDYLLQQLGQAFAAEGIEGDFSTWAGVEAAAGMTKDEIYETALGMSLDDFLDALVESLPWDQMSELAYTEGRYDLEQGRLYVNGDTSKEIVKSDYLDFTLEGDTLTFTGYTGNGASLFDEFPAVLTRVG